MAEHDELVVALGPYLLRTLDPQTRGRVRAHLETCEICRLELARLTAMPGLLALAGEPDPDPDLVPPSTLRERLATAALAERARERQQAADAAEAARQEERRRTRARGRVAAIALALLFAAVPATVLVTARVAQPPPTAAPSPPPTVAMTTVAQGLALRGRASVTDHTWGSEFFVLTEGPPGDDRFMLLAQSRDGRREQAAAWRNDDDGRVHCIGTTSIRQADLARLSVVSESGQELLVLETGQA